MVKEAFEISVPDEVLRDLQERLARVRYPMDFANENWSYGTNRAYLEELVAYWRTGYDWRKHEAEINRFSNFKTTIDNVPIHFIHEPGKGPSPIPLALDVLGFTEAGPAARRSGSVRRRPGGRFRRRGTLPAGLLFLDPTA